MGLTGASAILQVHPTRRCNLRCRHCYSSSGPWVADTTDLEVVRRTVADARSLGYDVLAVSGGEPLLFRDLLPLLRHAHDLGMRTAVTTNGLLLTERRLSELVGLVDVLAISLDGRPETHNWMRGDRRAFGQMSSRLPAVRDSGLVFAFITTLTMHNAHELEFVFEQAAEYDAALVQVHPLEPDGAGADLQASVPDSTELGFAFFEATRLSVVHDIPVQIDLVTQKDLRSAPERFLIAPRDPRASLGSWLTPLVLETDGTVVPLSYGFGRDYALGSVREAPLAALAERWDFEPLRRQAVALYDELVRDDVKFTNWYERMMRRSTATPVDTTPV
ncbi:radical SAM protein [Kribbella sp. C-35]|uniref:radical SAM protein n=1 Tax=Kribbella sp. C-35 TaxID=2789276 RepID=UPI00397D5BB8